MIHGESPTEADLTRAQIANLRALAQEQLSVIDELGKVNQAVRAEATVTAWLLDKVIEAMGESRVGLAGQLDLPGRIASKGHDLPRVVDRQQFVMRRLDEIIKALQDEENEDEQFAGDGGGGGGGGGRDRPLVPPVAELKLLKAMQEDVNRQTVDADIRFKADGRIDPDESAQVKKLGDEQDEIRDLTEQMIRKLSRARAGG